MKHLLIITLLVISANVFSQVYPKVDSFDLSSDTTNFLRFQGKNPMYITWEFTTLDANDATLDVYYCHDDSLSCTLVAGFPITLNKASATYMTVINGDTANIIGLIKDNWPGGYVAHKVTLNSVTSGYLIRKVTR